MGENTHICRYMDFYKFLSLLSGIFYVPRKTLFLDEREKGWVPMKNRFVVSVVGGEEHRMSFNEDARQVEWSKYLEHLEKSRYLLTSCWTKDDGENYLMWRSYTDKMGVCVHTTIGRLIQALDYESSNYMPICSSIYYMNQNMLPDFLFDMFRKDIFYRYENEIRFYFVQQNLKIHLVSNEHVNQLLEDSAKEEEKKRQKIRSSYKEYHIFKIDPTFIDSITLSPFISENATCEIMNILCHQYKEIFKNQSLIKCSMINSKA